MKISCSSTVGNLLRPEDFRDWTKLTVTVDGIYSLPASLQEASGLGYSLKCLGASFSKGRVFTPDVAEEEPAPGGEGAEGGEGGGDHVVDKEQRLVGRAEMAEGLRKLGYGFQPGEDADAVWAFLTRSKRTNSSSDNGAAGGNEEDHGKLSVADLLPLEKANTNNVLLRFRAFVLEKKQSLGAAFDSLSRDSVVSEPNFLAALDQWGWYSEEELSEYAEKKEAALNVFEEKKQSLEQAVAESEAAAETEEATAEDKAAADQARQNLADLGSFQPPEGDHVFRGRELFTMLSGGEPGIGRGQWRSLHVLKNLETVVGVGKLQKWIAANFATAEELMRELEEETSRGR